MRRLCFALCLAALACSSSLAQSRRKIIIDQDSQGPAGSNIQTLALLIQSPKAEVLGITVVTGNQWRDDEVARALRLLEIMGRTDIPVVPGAVFPLVRTQAEAALWQDRYGKAAFAGAWDPRWYHEPFVVPQFAEGNPTTKPSTEDAAHFLLRMVRKYPHEVTIYEGGPMTNLAQAISIDPQFPELAQELVFMGGSLSPQTDNPEFANNPRHEFNFWMDPEAASAVLRAPWKKITCTPTDISVKTKLTPEMVKEIDASGTPLAKYVARFFHPGMGADYMWDELAAAAWLDPSLITKSETLYMDVDIDHGAGYGNTLTWSEKAKPKYPLQKVEIQVDLDNPRFNRMFVDLMRVPTPPAEQSAH
jgi:purine nucleosidase